MLSHPQYGDIYLVNFEPSTGHEYRSRFAKKLAFSSYGIELKKTKMIVRGLRQPSPSAPRN